MRAHVDVPLVCGGHRQLHWRPNFDRLPAPVEVLAFSEAWKWGQNRNMAAELLRPTRAVAMVAEGMADRKMLIAAPEQAVETRLQGKQRPPCAEVPIPVAKVRAAARPLRPQEDQLNDVEVGEVEGLTRSRRHQALKRVLHNGTPVVQH